MIELTRDTFAKYLALAKASSKMIVPQLNEAEPLLCLPPGGTRDWPDIICAQESTLTVIRVRQGEAYLMVPFKRLNHKDLHKIGMVKFEDLLMASRFIGLTQEATYRDIAKMTLDYQLTGYLHRIYQSEVLPKI